MTKEQCKLTRNFDKMNDILSKLYEGADDEYACYDKLADLLHDCYSTVAHVAAKQEHNNKE